MGFAEGFRKEMRIGTKKKKKKSLSAEERKKLKEYGQVARFGKVALAQQADFTPEQEALSSMFGGGEKTWGTNREPVRINNDLHPSLSNSQDETASMFGFGGRI